MNTGTVTAYQKAADGDISPGNSTADLTGFSLATFHIPSPFNFFLLGGNKMSRSSVEWYKQPHKSEANFAPMISLPQSAQIINGVYTTVVQPFGIPPLPYGSSASQPFKPIPLTGEQPFAIDQKNQFF